MKLYLKQTTYFLFSILLMGCTSSNHEIKVKWVESTIKKQWEEKVLYLQKPSELEEGKVKIFTDQPLQTVKGFGGCFNELGYEALNILSEDARKRIIHDLFDQKEGCNFTICRMPIGANDYAVNWYSHNETKDDFEMNQFSINRDKERLIPYINWAKQINPDIKIWGSPWCPPSWMKTNNHYACKPDVVNDLTEEGRGEEMHTQFRMEEKYLKSYALYFSKFVEAYKKEGIDIYAVHVQNELNSSCQNFPSCIWHPKDMATFIGDYLGPEFINKKLKTEIWLGTVERKQEDRVDDILLDHKAQKYIKGVGFQWAGKGAIPYVNTKYPNLELMQTESECGNGSNDWAAAKHTFDLIKHYFKNGANSYMYWNMVLDETGKSHWGWKQNSMITVNSDSKSVVYNPEFYLMKHFSAFVEKNSKYLKTSDENCLAFKCEKQYVVFYHNNSTKKQVKEFVVDGKSVKLELAPDSFHTFIMAINE
ncbi:glycoside hydrolase family 30 protein [Flammeovirga pacifica]|uniref:Glycosyl hydrolase family 30 TIM-barrel domain-containing protein n=1 Tax=Flammeovirga pacifica TaxID=915059 RepID=A0A1S1YSD2_FLAPC|nr:hypothetical protein [Flammeovirga pacifica]OHX63916.1 hypothetical protein NH26_20105 [Flammeovirga pacifica]